jgi:hypothetical protein
MQMKRISLVFAGALACLAFAAVGTASAMPTEGTVNTSCSTTSKRVAGPKVTATVTGRNVAPSQMKYAECKIVKKVLNTVIKRVVERPTAIEGFRITPSITSEAPLTIKYTGLFRGADTATEIRLKFKVVYVGAPVEPETPKVDTTCTTNSKNVIGHKVKIAVAGKNVAESQQEFAECPTVKKVANKMLSLRIEKPKVFEGFRCTPTVFTGGEGTVEPQVVRYKCLFRGADTATEIRLTFKVTYNTD